MLRKTIRIAFIIMSILLVSAFAAPFLFKGKFISLAKNELNKSLRARAEFSDVDISLFRSFPRLSVALEGLQITGQEKFTADTLLSAKRIDIAVNFFSIFNTSDIQVYAITLDEPRIHAIVLKDGSTNWDIAKGNQEEKDMNGSGHFRMALKKYAIHNGYLEYRDEEGNMYAELKDINHEGSGNLGSEKYTLSTATSTGSATFRYEGIPYLVNAVAGMDADLDIDAKEQRYRFSKASARINDLTLNSDGYVQLINDSTYGMDIRFDAPAVDFKSILSLIPAIYKNDFATIKTGGKAEFNGFVKGRYGNTEIPAYKINLDIKDGFFQYPDLPDQVKNISLSLHAENPDGILDHTVINIRNGHIEMDKMPFDFRLLLRNPMTDRYIDGAVKGRLDLSRVSRYVKLEQGTKLSGILDADIEAKGKLAVIQQQVPGEFSARGYIDISELYYASASFPQPVQHTSARIMVDNPDGEADHTVINIPAAHVELGKDIADLSLLIKNPATDPQVSGKARGTVNLENINQFYTFDPGTSVKGTVSADLAFNGRKSQIDKEEYQSVELSGLLTGKDIRYITRDYPGGLALRNAGLRFTPKYVHIDQLEGQFEKTNFTTTGTFDNLVGYVLKDEPLKGTLNIHADKIDLNQWMGTDTSTGSSSTAGKPFPVPGNVDVTVNAKASLVHYDKVDYSGVNGKLLVRDEKIQLSNMTMNALGGSIAMDGYYSTKMDKLHPEISFHYDVKNLDIRETFLAFNTVRKLMPAAQFISGRLHSQLNMKGLLGADMMPDLSSLTGNGNLLLLEGFLNKFAPLDKMASTLNISELEGISLKDVKNYFAFTNGKVLVKPFQLKVKGIDMEIGGLHGIDQSIDYQVNMKVPRALMGKAGNEYLDQLALQASSTGLPVKLNDMVNLSVKMGGSMLNPVMTTNLRQSTQALADDMKKQAADFVQARADSTKKAAKDSAIVIRDKMVTDTRDALISQLSGTKDSAGKKGFIANDSKKRIEKAGSDLFRNAFKKKKTADSTNR